MDVINAGKGRECSGNIERHAPSRHATKAYLSTLCDVHINILCISGLNLMFCSLSNLGLFLFT